jgi:hypothetical protein
MPHADRFNPPGNASPSLQRVENSAPRAIALPLSDASLADSEFAKRTEAMEQEAERWDAMS